MRKVIYTDGTELELPTPIKFEQIGKLIGATMFDTVNLRHLGHPLHIMIVDDNGYETKAITKGVVTELKTVRARKPLNQEATRLYHANCHPGTTHQIVGNVAIVPDSDFE